MSAEDWKEHVDEFRCPRCMYTITKDKVVKFGDYRYCPDCLADALEKLGLKELEIKDYCGCH